MQKDIYKLQHLRPSSDVHYAMPVRSMLYDAMNYGKQVNEAKRRHEKNKDIMSSAEFLSGFTKVDKLTPIKANEEGEVTDVCLAIEEMKRKAAEKAVAETRAEMKKEAAKTLIDNVESIMKNLHISLESACKALNHTLEDYEKAKALVESLAIA